MTSHKAAILEKICDMPISFCRPSVVCLFTFVDPPPSWKKYVIYLFHFVDPPPSWKNLRRVTSDTTPFFLSLTLGLSSSLKIYAVSLIPSYSRYWEWDCWTRQISVNDGCASATEDDRRVHRRRRVYVIFVYMSVRCRSSHRESIFRRTDMATVSPAFCTDDDTPEPLTYAAVRRRACRQTSAAGRFIRTSGGRLRSTLNRV